MRKYLVLLCVLAAGCAVDIPVHDYMSICEWIHENVPYDSSPIQKIRSPKQTLEDGGDCVELSILMLKMVNDEYGVKGELVFLDYVHCVVLLDIYYDPTTGRAVEELDNITSVRSYEVSMMMEAMF